MPRQPFGGRRQSAWNKHKVSARLGVELGSWAQTMVISRHLLGFWLVAAGLVVGGWNSVAAQPSVEERPPEPTGDTFDDPPLRLVEKSSPTEAEQDATRAAALFTHGRVLLQRGELLEALRRYQRAWRYDSSSVSVMAQILPVALHPEVNRPAEATRYAVLGAEREPVDPGLLAQVAVSLTDSRDFSRALRVYEKLLESRAREPLDIGLVTQYAEMGRLCLLTEQPDRAAEYLAKVRDALEHPQQFSLRAAQVKKLAGPKGETFLLLAEGFLEAGRYDAAEAMFRRVDELEPSGGLLAYRLAEVDARRGNWNAVIAQLDTFMQAKIATQGLRPYELLAEALQMTAGKEQGPIELLTRIEQYHAADPQNHLLGYFLARKQLDAGQAEKAEALYSRLLAEQPAADALRALVQIFRTRPDAEKLLATLGRTALEDPTLEVLEDQLKAVLQDAELSAQLIQRSREPAAGTVLPAGAALACAQVAIELKRFDDADALFEVAAIEPASSGVDVLGAWGRAMLIADQPDRASRAFRRALEKQAKQDDQPQLYFFLAATLELAGETDAALVAAKRAASLSSDSALIQSRVPWVLYHAKRYAEAETQYQQLLHRFEPLPEASDVRDVLRETRLILSNLCVAQNRLPEAEEWLEQVLDEFPEDIGAMNDLGYLWADQNKRLGRALSMIEKAVAAEPENTAYRDSLGWVYFRLNRFDEAVRELELATGKEDPDGVILDHLGDAYLKTGRTADAVAVWKRALDAFRRDGDQKQLTNMEEKLSRHSVQLQ